MEDITDEIKDLQQSINATGGEGEDGRSDEEEAAVNKNLEL